MDGAAKGDVPPARGDPEAAFKGQAGEDAAGGEHSRRADNDEIPA